MRPGTAGAYQHLQKQEHIHTCPKQRLKSLTLSAGEDHDKDLSRQTGQRSARQIALPGTVTFLQIPQGRVNCYK